MSDVNETAIEMLARYYDSTRRAGHSQAVRLGTQERGANEPLVLVAERMSGEQAHPGSSLVTLDDLRRGALHGKSAPLVIDNHAIGIMAREVASLRASLTYAEASLNGIVRQVERAREHLQIESNRRKAAK